MISPTILLLLVSLSCSQNYTPPFWGGNPQYTVKVLMTNNAPAIQWNFTYYYDATIKAERYQHTAPQADQMCLFGKPPFTVNDSCVVIFSDDGWSYIQYPQHNWCCKCGDSFHYVNYDWLQVNSTFVGIEKVNGYTVEHWTKEGLYLNHYYSTVGGLPVKFFQLKNKKPKAWDFDLSSYQKGPVDRSKFKAPCQNLCGGKRQCPKPNDQSNIHKSIIVFVFEFETIDLDHFRLELMGVYLSDPNTEKDSHSDSSKLFRYSSCEMQGWRKSMEDAKICELAVKVNNKSYAIFGVFDGHGGFQVSRFVEQHFVQELVKNEEFKRGNVELALQQNFRRMDEMLESTEGNNKLAEIRKTKEQGSRVTSYASDHIANNTGCTANVVVIDDQFYYTANSGDSRSVLSRAGKIISLSEDHKPECEIQKNRIEKAGGAIINGRVNGGLNLTRALGDFEYKKSADLGYKEQMITCHPDVTKIARHADDQFILVGCDGIWQRYVTDSQPLIDIVGDKRKKQKDTKVLMEDLLDNLLAKNTFEEVGCDNMTAILVDIFKN